MKKIIMCMVVAVLLSGCGTFGPIKDVRYLRDKPIVLGKVRVLLNGEDITSSTCIMFNTIWTAIRNPPPKHIISLIFELHRPLLIKNYFFT